MTTDIDYEKTYHQIMGLLRNIKLKHGTCLPIERNACTHCAAQRKLDILLDEYKGIKVILAAIEEDGHCPICGYTKEDAAFHCDHYLCDGEIPDNPQNMDEG